MPIEMPRRLPFSVDTFTPNSKIKRHHFLTHAHKDHCSGISNYCSYPIYCTHLTKSIILCYFPQLDESLFVGIEVGQSITVDDPDGSFKVTAFDANHCPGAVMFLFQGGFGNILHTGDCRLTPECLQYLPEKYIARKGKKPDCPLDFVFLDCTFGKSLMKIPTTQSALQQVINCIWKYPDAPTVYLTCNLLGQEEIIVHVSKTFGSRIYVDRAKHPDFYQSLALIAPQIISEDPICRFHLFEGFPKLYERAKRKIFEARENMQPEPLIIRPSAQWYACEETELTVRERKVLEKSNIPVKDHFGVWHVCYSMHSSRQELEWALELLAPKWVVSTTPECRAMELEYVKKHCLISQVSDARVWKLLDMTMEPSPKVDTLSENDSTATELTSTHEGLESQLPKLSPSMKCILRLSPLKQKPVITLFGRARQGYYSSISAEETKSLSVDSHRQVVVNKAEQKLPPPDAVVESKVEKVTENMTNKAATKLPRSDDNVLTEVHKLTESKIHIDDAVSEPTVLRKDTTVCRSVSCSLYSSYSSTSTGLKGFSDNFRKLHRSMNVPIPRPLPSLVELMKTKKRAKLCRH